MCGFVIASGAFPETDVYRSLNLLAHRGPDGAGIRYCPEIDTWFGHRRLAVRGPGFGKQPMLSISGKTVLVFNGEIYNDRFLVEQLRTHGRNLPRGHSDTEVLVESLELWGPGILKDLEGMFSIVWANLQTKHLWMARDRFGQKPLFYSLTDRGLIAASETESLHSLEKFQISEESVRDYFNHGYMVPPLTLARNMYQVLPGDVLTFDFRTQTTTTARFWSGFELLQRQKRAVELEEIKQQVENSIRRRLVSDRKIGMLLSGGIDSALVASHFSNSISESLNNLTCVTIGFSDRSFDESLDAVSLASSLGLSHELVPFQLPSLESMVEMLQLLDEPMGDTSFLPTFQAFQASRTRSTVILTGDGGDELFLGYDPFRLASSQLILEFMSTTLGKKLMGATRRLIPTSNARLSKRFLLEKLSLSDASQSYLIPALMSPLTSHDSAILFDMNTSDDERFSHHDHLWGPSVGSSLSALQRWFLSIYLPSSVLSKVDRASMLHGLEARACFLDNDLLATALAIPEDQSVSIRRGKKPLRKIMAQTKSQNIGRLKKKGFGAPVSELLRLPGVREQLVYSVPGIDNKAVTHFYDLHRNHKRDFRQFLYSYLSLVHCAAFRRMSTY